MYSTSQQVVPYLEYDHFERKSFKNFCNQLKYGKRAIYRSPNMQKLLCFCILECEMNVSKEWNPSIHLFRFFSVIPESEVQNIDYKII